MSSIGQHQHTTGLLPHFIQAFTCYLIGKTCSNPPIKNSTSFPSSHTWSSFVSLPETSRAAPRKKEILLACLLLNHQCPEQCLTHKQSLRA